MLRVFLFWIISICVIDTIFIIVNTFRNSKLDELSEKELEDYTLDDCLVMYHVKKQCADIRAGKLLGFNERRSRLWW